MKKLALIIAVAGIVGLSSCGKAGEVKCTQSFLTIKTTITVTEDEAESCTAGFCTTSSLGSLTQDEYVSSLESAGYSCK